MGFFDALLGRTARKGPDLDALFALPCDENAGIERNCGGSSAFRKPQFAVWIGYDF